jgi:hypothetical protein
MGREAVDASKRACLRRIPPLTTCFVHPSLLHHFTLIFATCLTHTHPFQACLVHLSLLHHLTSAPCSTHTPPALFLHPPFTAA